MVEETICLQCGNRGFENAFVYCIRCLKFAVHRYCLDEIPETFDEFVCWLCDDCEVKVRKRSAVFKHDAIPCQTRHHKVSKNIKTFSRNGKVENGLVIVDNEHVCKDASKQAFAKFDLIECGELASQHSPVELDGKNDENINLLPVDVSKISEQSLRLHQLTEEKVEENLIGSIELSAGCLTECRLTTSSYDECVKVDIDECTRLTSDSTLPFIVNENGCSEQKNQEEKIEKKKKRKRKKPRSRKRNIMEYTTEKDQHRLATTSYDECVKVDIKECTRSGSDSTLLSKVKENGCSELKDQEETKIKNNKKRKRKRKRNIMGSTTEKDQHRLATTSYNECVKVNVNECTRSGGDSTLPSKVKENGCSEQKDHEKKRIKNNKKGKRKRKRNIMGSTTEKDQHRLATTSSNEHVKVDINECTRSESDSTLPSNVKENEGCEQKDQTCITKPFESITDLGIAAAHADHHVISSGGASKNLSEKKIITSSVTISQKQVHRTGVAQTLHTNKCLYLENELADLSTREKDVGSSNDRIEKRGPEDEEEQTSTSYQSRNTCASLTDLDYSAAQPIAMPVWRGSFNIWNSKYDSIDELVAHISNKACHKVYEAASQFQPVLHLEMLPKSDIWPKGFQTSEPNGDNIALYFFPSNMGNKVFEQLVEEMIHKELAFKGLVQNAELLIFTSTELPLLYWRFQNKYYLWGVFRGKKAAPSNPLSRIGEVAEIPSIRKICDDRSPVGPLSNSATSGSGAS